MDTIPDHTRERVMRANGEIDWITEEWIRRAGKAAEAGYHETEARRFAGRYVRRVVGAYLSACLAALSDRFRERSGATASFASTDVGFEG